MTTLVRTMLVATLALAVTHAHARSEPAGSAATAEPDPWADPAEDTQPAPAPAYSGPTTRDDVFRAHPELHKRHRSAKTWAIAGGVTAAIGFTFIVNGLWMILRAPDVHLRGVVRGVGWVSTIGGIMAFVPGITIMSVGLKRRADVLEEADELRVVQLRPWMNNNAAGLALTLGGFRR